MPEVFYCNSCHLLLEFGDYHADARRGWRSINLCGCIKCGTQYRVLHSIDAADYYAFEKQPEPLNGKLRDNIDLYEPTQYIDYQPYVFPQESAWDWSKIPHNALEASFKVFICSYCGSGGSLSTSGDDFSTCPRCRQDTFELVGFWMA